MLPPETFKLVVESTPLVAIDFVVRAPDGKILLGKRNNRPAQDSWLVPGGRILKDEPVKLTFSRLLGDELDLDLRMLTLILLVYINIFTLTIFQ